MGAFTRRGPYDSFSERLLNRLTLPDKKSHDLEGVIRHVLTSTKYDVLVFMSLKHWAAKDYDDFVEMAEARAKQMQQKLNKDLVKAEYLNQLSKTLTYDMIEPTFYIPENLDKFLERELS